MSAAAAASASPLEPDHLVVACRTLAEGRAWCEATFGVAPAPGGRHALMGTHNLLLAISSSRFPRSYLELIAIDPDASVPARPRWFELDRPEIRALVASGPRLVHWVARTTDIDAAATRLRNAGFDPGPVADAERMTARGLLRWRIALTAGGRRHAEGAVPLLIAWGDVHPIDSLPVSGVELRSLRVSGIEPSLSALLGVDAGVPSSAALVAELAAP
ncbi:MAG: VOC family protein, partial [Caldimonas sp.]